MVRHPLILFVYFFVIEFVFTLVFLHCVFSCVSKRVVCLSALPWEMSVTEHTNPQKKEYTFWQVSKKIVLESNSDSVSLGFWVSSHTGCNTWPARRLILAQTRSESEKLFTELLQHSLKSVGLKPFQNHV